MLTVYVVVACNEYQEHDPDSVRVFRTMKEARRYRDMIAKNYDYVDILERELR